jgi:small subunit ribosomal protein S16
LENAVAVRIRLKRFGRAHHPTYRLAAVDSRAARDSKVIEELGSYDPMNASQERQVTLKRERIEYWLGVGAQPSDTVRRLLEHAGIVEDRSDARAKAMASAKAKA